MAKRMLLRDHVVAVLHLFLLCNSISLCFSRKHYLDFKDETRTSFPISMFGFLQGGILNVTIVKLSIPQSLSRSVIGFSLDRTLSDAANPYLDSKHNVCLKEMDDTGVARFTFDFAEKVLKVTCSDKFSSVGNIITIDDYRNKRSSVAEKLSDSSLFKLRQKRQTKQSESSVMCNSLKIPLTSLEPYSYSTNFTVHIMNEEQEGMYNLYFRHCSKEIPTPAINITMEVTESNGASYLSAGEMPLPMLYFIMSTMFLASGCFWVGVLCKSK